MIDADFKILFNFATSCEMIVKQFIQIILQKLRRNRQSASALPSDFPTDKLSITMHTPNIV